MPAIIEQIQRDALDTRVSVSSLLRRVKLAAAKLNLNGLEVWVEKELSGYKEDVPEYRQLTGQPMAFNPYRGWIPITGEVAGWLSKRGLAQPIASIEDLISRSEGENGELQMPYSPDIAALLDRHSEISWGRYALHIDRSQIVHVVESVRNLVLDWAIQLEKSGVMGTEFSFSEDDRKRAQTVGNTFHIGSIGNLTGNLGTGNVVGDISVGSVDARQASALADQIARYLPQLAETGIDMSAVQKNLGIVQEEASKPHPDTNVLRGALNDLRNVVSGAAGNLVASGIIEQISKLLN